VPELKIIQRAEHSISRKKICRHALSVLKRLKDAGYRSCLVGGGVRDLLVGMCPKDFDIATDATPEQIRQLFRNCRLIGRRFRLAHIHFGREFIEVATFRGTGNEDSQANTTDDGRVLSDNVYGSIEEDAVRRDFTVNALFYDIQNFAVFDYVNGYEDLQKRLLRLIGDPEQRYREDPVRLLRAVRFAAKLGFDIEPETEAPLFSFGHLLEDIPPARLFDESLKLFLSGHAVSTFKLLRHYGLLEALFPETAKACDAQPELLKMLNKAMQNTDLRIKEAKPVTPAFLFATLLWPPFYLRFEALCKGEMSPLDARYQSADEVVTEQVKRTSLPRRFSVPMREIWHLQHRFAYKSGKRARRLLDHKRFRAGYDFLLLRCEYDDSLQPLADFWTEIQEKPEAEINAVLFPDSPPRRNRRRKRRQHQNSEQLERQSANP